MRRPYPVRITKNRYRVNFNSFHVCSRRCSKKILQTNDTFILIDNPDYIDGKCSRSKQIEKTLIRLEDFDLENPQGLNGPLYNKDEIIIQDSLIKIPIVFPLNNPIEIIVKSNKEGFTLGEVIYLVKTLYSYIYEEEERSSPLQRYVFNSPCDFCENINPKDSVKPGLKEGLCPICYDNYNETTSGELLCGHLFHQECIEKWIDTDGKKNCPLCRATIGPNCLQCNGERKVTFNFFCRVLPQELRDSRPLTHGTFSIWGYDYDDLLLERISYDRIKKKLELEIIV